MNDAEKPAVQPEQAAAGRKPWATPTVTIDLAASTRSNANNLGIDGTSTYSGATYGS